MEGPELFAWFLCAWLLIWVYSWHITLKIWMRCHVDIKSNRESKSKTLLSFNRGWVPLNLMITCNTTWLCDVIPQSCLCMFLLSTKKTCPGPADKHKFISSFFMSPSSLRFVCIESIAAMSSWINRIYLLPKAFKIKLRLGSH